MLPPRVARPKLIGAVHQPCQSLALPARICRHETDTGVYALPVSQCVSDTHRLHHIWSRRIRRIPCADRAVQRGRRSALHQPVRRLLPLDPPSWDGGSVSFTMKVDPDKPNYFTARFSGDEVTENRLMLYVEGKQIGWRHLGEVDQLDFGTWEPAYPGRFYYSTSPLAGAVDQRQDRAAVRDSQQRPHLGLRPRLRSVPEADDRAVARALPGLHAHRRLLHPARRREAGLGAGRIRRCRQTPGPEVLDQVKERVNRELDSVAGLARPDQPDADAAPGQGVFHQVDASAIKTRRRSSRSSRAWTRSSLRIGRIPDSRRKSRRPGTRTGSAWACAGR